jgi:hypothetical protein
MPTPGIIGTPTVVEPAAGATALADADVAAEPLLAKNSGNCCRISSGTGTALFDTPRFAENPVADAGGDTNLQNKSSTLLLNLNAKRVKAAASVSSTHRRFPLSEYAI